MKKNIPSSGVKSFDSNVYIRLGRVGSFGGTLERELEYFKTTGRNVDHGTEKDKNDGVEYWWQKR